MNNISLNKVGLTVILILQTSKKAKLNNLLEVTKPEGSRRDMNLSISNLSQFSNTLVTKKQVSPLP